MMFLRFYDDDPISVVCMTISIDTMTCVENLMMRCDGKSSPFQDDKIVFSLCIHAFCFVNLS